MTKLIDGDSGHKSRSTFAESNVLQVASDAATVQISGCSEAAIDGNESRDLFRPESQQTVTNAGFTGGATIRIGV